jgi:hypothetical protein
MPRLWTDGNNYSQIKPKGKSKEAKGCFPQGKPC